MRRSCKAKTRAGKSCKGKPILGGAVCRMHGGAAPQVKNKAKERIRQYVADMVDKDRLLQEAARLAFSDIRLCYDENGTIKPVKDWPDELAAAVRATKNRRVNLDAADGHTDLVTELQVWDKPKNIEMLFKHLGLFEADAHERVDVTYKWAGE